MSNSGRVRLTDRVARRRLRSGVVGAVALPDLLLSQEIKDNGYAAVSVTANGRRSRLYVHRLVARLFVPGYAAGLSVNHIDGNKANNEASNLEWVTLSVNTQKQWADGLINTRGQKHYSTHLTENDVKLIRALRQAGTTLGALAQQFGLSTSGVHSIVTGKTWAHVT